MSGYRLRIIRLVPMPAVGYGSDTYGAWTYGTRQTDAPDLQRYEIVPLEMTAYDYPLMLRRIGDTEPMFSCRLISYASEYENTERAGIPMDLAGVTAATMQLWRYSGGPGDMIEHPMEIDLPYILMCHVPIDTVAPYRMTIPVDDRFTVVARPNVQTTMVP